MAVRHTELFKHQGYVQTPGVMMIDVPKKYALNKQMRDEKLMTDRVTSEVTKMLYRFCKLNPKFIGTRSDFEAGLKSFSRSPDARRVLFHVGLQDMVRRVV